MTRAIIVSIALMSVAGCRCGPKIVGVPEETCETNPALCPVKTCETDPSLCPKTCETDPSLCVPICETDPSQCPKTCETDPSLCPVKTGSIDGRVCAGDGRTWLAAATIYVVKTDGMRVTTMSDSNGNYHLAGVPVGSQVVHIEKGSFATVKTVTVEENRVTVIPEDVCHLDIAPRIAVVKGSAYDMVEGVLVELGVKTDKLDVYQTDWAEKLLATDTGLDNYDILFLNCRSYEGTFVSRTDMQQRLRNFINRGGKLHASDQAYDIIEVLFPDKIDFFGDDAVRGAADQGNIADLSATVMDTGLATGLGSGTVPLHYGLTTWSVMTGVGTGTYVYVKANSPMLDGTTVMNSPQIVGFKYGMGHVVYSSFHQEPGIGVAQENILKLLMFEL